MKYSDIVSTQEANYSTDVSLSHLKCWLELHEEEAMTFRANFDLNPDFKRGHVWTKEQQIKYVEAIFQNPYLNKNIMFNSSFYRNYKIESSYTDMVCVDGSQRLIACLKFLNNEIQIFGHYKRDFEDVISKLICLKIHFNSLQTKKEVLQWYLDLNSGGTIHTKEELEKVRSMLESIDN